MLTMLFIILGHVTMVRATPTAPKPGSTVKAEASPTSIQTAALDKEGGLSGVVIGLIVLGCIIAVLTMACLVFLCCSATWRRSNPGADVELQQSQTTDAPAQTPTPSQFQDQDALPEVSQVQPARSGSYDKWKKQRDARQKEHKEWMRKRRAEMEIQRRGGRA